MDKTNTIIPKVAFRPEGTSSYTYDRWLTRPIFDALWYVFKKMHINHLNQMKKNIKRDQEQLKVTQYSLFWKIYANDLLHNKDHTIFNGWCIYYRRCNACLGSSFFKFVLLGLLRRMFATLLCRVKMYALKTWRHGKSCCHVAREWVFSTFLYFFIRNLLRLVDVGRNLDHNV